MALQGPLIRVAARVRQFCGWESCSAVRDYPAVVFPYSVNNHKLLFPDHPGLQKVVFV